MGDAHEILSYTVTADDRASAVFRGVGAEITKLSRLASTNLQGIGRDMGSLSGKKPLEFVRADQALVLAKTESEMAKLNKTVASGGVATKLQSAEMGVLTQRHKDAQKAIDATTLAQGRHEKATKLATAASYGVLAATAAIVTGAVKQGIAWEDLGKKIEQQTGLSSSSVKGLLGVVNNVTGSVPYKLNEISEAAVLLKTKFHETNPEIEKQTGLMDAFAQRAERGVTPAVTGLLSIMQLYKRPLGDVVGLTDELVGVSQATQKPMGELLSVVEKYGPKLQAMGFGLKESIALLGTFQASGISTSMLGRGLSQALTTADKRLGVSATNPGGNPQEALQKEGLAVEKARATLLEYTETIPKTAAQQNQLDRERKIATAELGDQETKYTSLKKSIEQSGGAQATTASVVRGYISDIEHAKTKQEAFNIGVADFGKQAGPSMALAFYRNQKAIEEVDQAQRKHGETAKLVQAQESTLGGTVTKLDEEWHKTERTLSTVLMPAFAAFLKLTSKGVEDIEDLVHAHASLSEILGAGATIGAGAFLTRKVTGIDKAAGGAGSLLSKLTGIGGSSAVTATEGVHGYTGNPAMAGSRMNPIAVVTTSGVGGMPLGGSSMTATKAAESDASDATGLLSKLKAGGAGVLAAAGPVGALVGGEYLAAEGMNYVGEKTGIINHKQENEQAQGELNRNIANQLLVGSNKLLAESTTKVAGAEEELAKMRAQGETHTEAYEQALGRLSKAEGDHKKGLEGLTAAEGLSTGQMRSQIEGELAKLDSTLASHPSASTRASVVSNYKQLVSGIGSEMGAASSAVGKGVESINKQLLGEVKALNGGKVASLAEGGPPLAAGVEKALATGGRVPGAVGPDNWTLLDPSGRAAAKVGGSELLIANRHTEAAASRATMAYYGRTLGEMVSGESAPHSMATGGRTHYDRLMEAANTVSGDDFPYKWGGGHEQPAHLEPFDCSGAVSYAVQQAGYNVATTTSGQIGSWGFPGGPGEATIFYNPTHTFMRIGGKYWGTSGFARPGGGAGWFDQDPAASYLSGLSTVHLPGLGADTAVAGAAGALKTPGWGGPGGQLGTIGRDALAKVTASANARVAKLAARGGGTGTLSLTGQELEGVKGHQLTPAVFAQDLLGMMGIPASGQAVQDMVAWEAQEGGNWHNLARYNPLNTTYPMPGAGNTGSQGNIKVYTSWDQGLEATAKTLQNYPGILAALRKGTLCRLSRR